VKIVLQRVKQARVTVDGRVTGEIGAGLCLLVGVEKRDNEDAVVYLAGKALGLRIFSDGEGRMNLSVRDIGGEILAVSQFTLAGSVRKGRRPSFDRAEDPEPARRLFDRFVDLLREDGIPVATGVFGAKMEVALVNDGPVTFILQSPDKD
jgi:D-aminoacyl-tRNA deacylase